MLIYHTASDDPRKCTARKMARYGYARLLKRFSEVPYGAVVLDPTAGVALSPSDRELIERKGILAVDCSWKEVDTLFPQLKGKRRLVPRALPYLVPVNPVNFGKPFQLSTLEAVIATLYIIGHREQAEKLALLYKWSQNFIPMNREPLDDYSGADDSNGVLAAQAAYMEG